MTSDAAIRCLCAYREEKLEMVCCEVCEVWSHLSCMRVKERVWVMEGKEFVCQFFVSLLVGTAEKGGWVERGIALSQG